MKGFGIEIKNDLLDPKHIDAMGPSVWLYMWLLDKITSITEAGEGIILGGRPIVFDEVQRELGISPDTYTRWIDRLQKYPYISADRKTYGISFKVLKSYKRFGNRIRKNAESQIPHKHPQDSALLRNIDSAKPRNVLYTEQKNITVQNTPFPFEEFWNLYPKKVEKKKTEDKWKRLNAETREKIMKDLPNRMQSDLWKKGFVLNPMTYLNGERWNDEISQPSPLFGRIKSHKI